VLDWTDGGGFPVEYTRQSNLTITRAVVVKRISFCSFSLQVTMIVEVTVEAEEAVEV